MVVPVLSSQRIVYFRVTVACMFTLQVVIFNVDVPIIKGFPVILHFQATSEQAHFGRLIKELNRGTGEVIREKPRFVYLYDVSNN